jgi:hypothetical protein
MMRDPVSLRNIPKEVLHLAYAIHQHTGLSMSDVFRLALVSGMLIEATKVAPDHSGTLCGLDAGDVAKALRRHLSSAIDLLLEHEQHPYQVFLSSRNSCSLQVPSTSSMPIHMTSAVDVPSMRSIADDLDALGIGLGLSEALENQQLSS